MNKIYKVIWSKTRNCYVAVAEFVKRSGKGSSLNRRHIAAALATVAICAAPAGALANSGGHWNGNDYIGDAPDYKVVIDSNVDGWVYGRLESGDTTAAGASVTVTSGTVGGTVQGGYSWNGGSAEGNTVTISGGTVEDYVYGGYANSGSATGNTVTICGGTVKGRVFGGWNEVNKGSVANNTVIIRGGTIEGNVFGGYTGHTENVSYSDIRILITNNTIVLTKEEGKEAPILKGTLMGGDGSAHHADNTLQVEAAGLSAKEISDFQNYRFVLPKDIKAGDTMLTLKNQSVPLEIDANKVDVSMGGGTIADIGLTLDESVTLLHKKDGSGAFTVNNSNKAVYTKTLDDAAGGLPEDIYSLTASEDKLNVTYTERYLYGDGGTNTTGQRETGNTLIIADGEKASVAFGGRASNRDVTENKVIMSGGEIVGGGVIQIGSVYVSGNLYGGFADTGNAVKNAVELSGGTVAYDVYGGYSYSGNAENNTVTISGGKVDDDVYGGYSDSGDVTGNTVTISGGTVEEDVVGGNSWKGAATSNTVTISGGTVEEEVIGGNSFEGAATNNTVTITGGKVEGTVYGGYSSTRNATGNKVILSKQEGGTAPVISGTLFGGYSYDGGTVSNNTLQVEAVGLSAPEIQNFDNYRFVLPSDIEANEVMLELKNQGSKLEIDANRVDMAVAKGSGLNIDFGESVTLLEKTGGSGAFSVENLTGAVQTSKLDGVSTGFDVMKYKLDKPANEDKLNVTVSELFLYGDGGTNTKGRREKDNTLTINSGKAMAAFGGRATSGDATGNAVAMNGGEIVEGSSSGSYAGNLYGGLAENGKAAGNEVTISSGTVNDGVYGGYSSAGNAEENTVTVSGNSNAGIVVGGHSAAGGFAKSNRVIIHNMTEGYQVASATGGVADTGRVENNSVTVEGAAITYDIDGGIGYGEAIHNQVTLAKGEARGLQGGSGNGLVSQNTATLNEGGKTTYIYGGDAGSGIATKNEVIINGGRVDNQGVMEDAVYGGNAFNGDATYNKVTLNGGAINADVYGGHVWDPTSTGKATDNTVVLDTGATGKTFNSNLYGGKTNGSGDDISGNSLQVKGKGIAVTSINNFENYNFVLPADSKAGDTMLKLTGQGAGLTIDGSTVGVSLAKGTLADIGLNLDESVTLLHKTGGSGSFTVDNPQQLRKLEDKLDGVDSGFTTLVGKVQKPGGEDRLDFTVTEKYLYGDGGTNTPGQREMGNTLNITSGKATAGFGGRASSGDVTKNNVEMSGGELVYDTLYADIQGSLYGGLTDKGNANHNTVTVSGGKLKERVYGGASYDGNTENNTARISGGTVGTQVYGGRTYGGGNAVNNTVTIEGGTVGKRVYGGRSDGGNAVNNTVTIEGGTVGERVYGGRSDGGNAVNNTVTIEGGTVGERVYGGYASAAATGNAVNLTDTTHGLDGAKLYGYNDSAASHSGNELHVGGAKTYDKNGEAVITKGSWQGMDANGKHTNRVDTVANFDSIALHNVVWGDVPAISANEITNIGGLDVTGLEFFTHPNNSTVHEHAYKDYMVLVHSDGSELTGLSISYLYEGTVKKEPLTNEGIYYHDTTHHSTENGVTVDGIEKKRIYLADHNKSVDFSFHVDGDKIILGDVAFVKGGTARTLDGRFDVRNADIDAGGLKMTGAGLENAVAGDAMTVVDAEDAIKAKGATATMKAFADKTYDVSFSDDVTTNLTLSGTHTDTLSQDAEKTKLTYTVGEKNVSEATMTGNIAWQDGATHYTNKDYNFNTDAKTDLGGLTFAPVTTDPSGQSMTLIGSKAAGTVENAPASFGVSLAKANTTLDATAAGVATVANGDVTYSVTGVTLDKVTVNQVTASADSVPDTWTVAKDASGKTALTIDTDSMTLPSGSANKEHAILTTSGSFAGAKVTGKYAYASHSPFTKANGGVSIAGEKEGGVKLSDDSKSVVYHVVQDHVKDITLGSVTFAKDTTLLPVGNEYEFTKVNAVNAQNFAMNYAAPQNVAANDSMTLLQANNTLQANALLANMAADVKSQTQPYSFAPVDGVTVAAKITGSLGTTAKGDGFTYTVNSNQADKLTFGSVDWKDGGVLLTRPANITFEGAEVDTSKIHFKNVHGLDANKQMTLVSDFGNNAGKITGSKYYIGATLEGEGSATLNGSDLIFTTKTGTNPNPRPTPDPTPLHAQEQTHNTVMGQTAGVSLLASGAEQISQALNSLSLLDSFGGMTGTGGGTGSTTGTGTSVQTGGEGGSSGQSGSGGSEPSGQGQEGSGGSATGNEKGQGEGSDDRNKNGSGQSDQQESNAEANGIIIASVGGGHMHQETGSHVTSNSWNGVLGIGGKRAAKNGTWQYLAFVEHGRANFTLHSDTGRGDGTSKYVGGGLIGKWQNRRNVYVEASIRAGRMHDTASDMLYDEATGQSYGYDVHANYIGGHVGLGKVFYYDNGRNLDVYARYFHMKRDGVSFDAGGHFDLDSVTSSVLRVGARYGATDKKWNWYGGLAYEYEFDGKSTGRTDGAPIRAASIEGGSVRGEIGLRMEASKSSPWKADINLSGYAGKRRGISGNVAVAYTF